MVIFGLFVILILAVLFALVVTGALALFGLAVFVVKFTVLYVLPVMALWYGGKWLLQRNGYFVPEAPRYVESSGASNSHA